MVMTAVGAVHMLLLVGGHGFHFQLDADQVAGQRTQHQIGVLGVALLGVHADQQLAAAVLLNPDLTALPEHREALAAGRLLLAVGIFKDLLQGLAHGKCSWTKNQKTRRCGHASGMTKKAGSPRRSTAAAAAAARRAPDRPGAAAGGPRSADRPPGSRPPCAPDPRSPGSPRACGCGSGNR